MHRIERVELDLPDGSLPSLSQRFFAKTGLEPSAALAPFHGRSTGTSGRRTSQLRIACFEGACVKLSQIFTAPNQLTLLRMIFVPFIVIHLVEGRYLWALVVFVIAGFSDGLDGLLARTASSTNTAGAISRSDCGQASVEHDVSRALDLAQDPVEIYGAGLQPGHFDSCRQRGSVCDCRTAEFSAQHFWQGQYCFADRRRVFSFCLFEVRPLRGIWIARTEFLRATFFFTIISALHYVILVQQRLREHTHALPPARTPAA